MGLSLLRKEEVLLKMIGERPGKTMAWHFLDPRTTLILLQKDLLETVERSITLPTKSVRYTDYGVLLELPLCVQ